MISVKVDATQVLSLLSTYEAKVVQAIGQALYEGGEAVLAASKEEVPVRTGVLKGSGQVMPPQWDGQQWTVTLGYGGAASAYAWIVHENMAAHHEPPTKAKYLQDPFNRLTPDVIAHLGAAVNKALS